MVKVGVAMLSSFPVDPPRAVSSGHPDTGATAGDVSPEGRKTRVWLMGRGDSRQGPKRQGGKRAKICEKRGRIGGAFSLKAWGADSIRPSVS